MSILNKAFQLVARSGVRYGALGTLLTVMIGSAAAQTVSQNPLSAPGRVPSNLLLVPSVEWPTLDSMANLGEYDLTRSYVGYFDADKCYLYSYSSNESERHFYPVAKTTNRVCSTTKHWSGNWLNWAATQTIDPFRKALTGGYRVKDTDTTTWLEKARYDGNGANSIYPNRRIPAGTGSNATLVKGATPASWNSLSVRIWKLGNRMWFTGTGDLNASSATAYDPSAHSLPSWSTGTVYEVSIRVKVCDASVGLEDNCKQYSPGAKPEGLIQQYSERLRYSVFGYLNDSDMRRDGGVLRAKQKFVGEKKLDPEDGWIANANREWDPVTGRLIQNPDSGDASATTSVVGTNPAIRDSGVINYINKFGQMTTENHKSHDPVSELYYAAIRYLKKQGNVSTYTELSGTNTQRYNLTDGFPVITNWDDPIQYSCQNNAILGIGDANTHRDKNLPGNSVTTDEPARPAAVTNDKTINVVTATQKVAALEGITISTPFTGRENSAYLAGLAYDSHTKDLRADVEDSQTVSTFWVDVRENQYLEPRNRNQYWLAAKYGGFNVPADFDPYKRTAPLEDSWWKSDDLLAAGYPRPQNFYVASEADKMVQSLKRAFAKINADDKARSGSSLAANSTRLETGTRTFQAQFFNRAWRGELQAFDVNKDGSLQSTAAWQAGDKLTKTVWSTRKIYVHNPSHANKHVPFIWTNLNATQQSHLASPDTSKATQIVDYLRGNRANEESEQDGTLRVRGLNVLGDIVNSTPVYVGTPNARLHIGATFTGASDYDDFANDRKGRKAVVYVGANDGMLHGFDADTGVETYAFVPNTVISNGLKSYTDPTYEHRYFVDGEIAVSDIYDTGKKQWRTVLVGTLGRGGPGVFALDVTDPSNVSFLWEKSATDIPELGKNIGKPVIAQVANGDWRVLMGNGPGSSGGVAQLVSIRIRDGQKSAVTTAVANNNGLSAVLARDSDGDHFADVAYAGDLRGNLWKFSGLGGTPSVSKLFEARDRNGQVQPIMAAPLVGKEPATGTSWIFFGTGLYLDALDLENMQVQSWYGIKDAGSVSGRTQLIERKILAEGSVGAFTARVIGKAEAGDITSKKGWFIDLVSPVNGVEGERMVVPNRFQGVALIGTTRIPEAENPCKPSGEGWVMAIDPFTGARLPQTFFDATLDGEFNEADKLIVDGEPTIVSGLHMDSSPNNPIFVEDVMQVGLDDGTTETVKTLGSAVQAARMSWRELLN